MVSVLYELEMTETIFIEAPMSFTANHGAIVDTILGEHCKLPEQGDVGNTTRLQMRQYETDVLITERGVLVRSGNKTLDQRMSTDSCGS